MGRNNTQRKTNPNPKVKHPKPPNGPKPSRSCNDDASGSDDDEVVVASKKRGNKGNFHGQRLEFLRSRIDDYLSASAARKMPGNRSALETFWRQLCSQYWRKFPWRLSLKEEPDEDAPGVEEKDEDLSEEDRDKKAQIQTDMKVVHIFFPSVTTVFPDETQTLKNWFNRQRGKTHSIRSNPFFTYFAEMRAANAHPMTAFIIENYSVNGADARH
ncbi:hypothetical protein FB45DRAFT_1040638 [Roridomyces roridus]|uniref:Uncharacterized protein n=1 Tax=Roridomyces roridus TaxID=1738132 RepID=A0AAD7B0L9_9AGAR|nr:hypothetical protein FB45DRAFT_1040638 [Roridomyces roridus]